MFITDIPILAYHRIIQDDEPGDPEGFAISRSQFARQMQFLHDQGYCSISIADFFQAPEGKTPRQKKSLVLTFDDGYEDFLTNAYPVLRQFGFTATVFLVTDLIGKQSNWDGETGTPLMTWSQIETLAEGNVSFGSHSCTHPRLPGLDRERRWHELAASKECLGARLGQEVAFFSYPYGESNDEIRSLAIAAGYSAAFGVASGISSRFNIWRSECRAGDTLENFVFKLSPLHRYMHGVRVTLREHIKPILRRATAKSR